jgi:hypothetical protein
MTPAPDGFFGTTITTFSSSERSGSVHTITGADALKLLRLPATSCHLTREEGVQFLFMLQDELRVELIDEVQVLEMCRSTFSVSEGGHEHGLCDHQPL